MKPDKAGELRDVDVNAISLVSKAANGERFKIFKSDKSENEVPEVIEKNERGLFHILKNFFAGTETEVEKGAVRDIVNRGENASRLYNAMDALFKVLGLSRYGDNSEKPETDPIIIRAALEDFKNVAEDILIGGDDEVVKTVSEVQKSGRKISSLRLSKIKEVHAILGDLIADTENTEGGTSEVTKEELIEEVKKSVDTAIQPINERLEKLEKSEAEAAEVPETPDVGEVVKNALDEALKPLAERLARVEKARGLSNSQPEDINVKKSANDFWAGAFGF